MAKKTKKGKFITFEGGEGVGKSTQVARLAERLKGDLGQDVFVTREPGGSEHGEKIREVILEGAIEKYGTFAEALLFNVARYDHLEKLIKPKLEAGTTVICDRFMDSTRVYQGAEKKLDDKLLLALEKLAVGDMEPDLTIVLDIDTEKAMARANMRRGAHAADRFEKEDMQVQERRRQGFRDLASKYPARCVLVDAAGSQVDVAQRIWSAVQDRLIQPTKAISQLDAAVASLVEESNTP